MCVFSMGVIVVLFTLYVFMLCHVLLLVFVLFVDVFCSCVGMCYVFCVVFVSVRLLWLCVWGVF